MGAKDEPLLLHDRIAIVTGGAGGIGRAVCREFAAQGAAVVVVDVDERLVEETVDEIAEAGGGPGALGLTLSVTREADMDVMVRRTTERFGGIDVLVTAAGILRGPGCLPHPVTDVLPQEWDAVLDVNLRGVFLSNRAVLPTMIRQRSGNIVNIASTAARAGRAHDAPYCASKAGVVGLSESVAEEARQYGVRIQVLLPDAVDTPIWQQNGPIRPDYALQPERVADVIRYLVTLPPDVVMLGTVVAPFRARRRTPRGAGDRDGRDRERSCASEVTGSGAEMTTNSQRRFP